VASILICSSPTLGHITPLAAVARHLVERGHQVRFLTGTRYESAITAVGAEFLPLPPAADIHLDDPREAFPQREGLTGIAAIRFDILNLFIAPAAAQFRALERAIQDVPTDAVLVEPLFLGAAPLTALERSRRPALMGLGIVPLTAPDPQLAPSGFGLQPMAGPLGRLRNAILSRVADRTFGPIFAQGKAIMDEIGVASDTLAFDWLIAADAMVQFTVASFEYPRARMPESVHFVGPVAKHIPSTAPLPDWWGKLDDGRPVIHVTQGTVANKDLDELTRPAIAALRDLDAHVIITTGGRPVSELGDDLPSNVLVAPFIPHDVLLPRTDLMITNGGYGGVQMALRHGVPLVVAGKTEDKAEVAARVAWSGVGIDLRTNRPTPAALKRATKRVLDDPRYAAAAARIAREIAAAPGLDELERLLLEQLEAPVTRG
jgi:MGT family glycosyltransferase